ncbi:NAD(P)/FAD-dependent oxidoreductase [Oceanitalea stevensii]|uniref:NAD(P)/FAD-dependent oxidoreductase n=1 Tax=Oceanitalea stevensii TaxID=2763072 RepID=UPI002044D3DB|nr:NAD(P)/FAD-dependent oxidoreductase [Oceanitalea stevensii]
MSAAWDTDVLVVGAGLAGLHVAALLAGRGHAVSVVDKRTDLGRAVRTTGIFVRRTLDDFALPEDRLGPPIRRVALYPPSLRRPVVLDSDRDEFRVGDMPGLYAAFTDRAREAGARVLLGTRYAGYADGAAQLVGSDGAPSVAHARFVVGADGARSRVARDLHLDRNERLLVGAEEVFASAGTEVPAFHCVLHPRLAPGYLGWVVDDGEHVHLGTAGYGSRYPDGVWRAMRDLAAVAPGLPSRPDAVERRGGPIPVGGLLRRISSPRGLLVGDAAGAVSPLTAGGLDPCLRLSEHAADALDDALTSGDAGALRSYDGAALRRRFRGRVAMRRAMGLVRSPGAMEATFAALRTPPGQRAARSIFFADRSFPLPAPV